MRAQTAIDFWGRRWLWMAISIVLLVITALSLWQRGLDLGIDFEGGVAWDVPASDLTIDDARSILDDEGLESDQAKIQERRSDSGDIIKVQVEDQPEEVRVRLQEAFAEAAGVDPADVSVAVGERQLGRGDHPQGGVGAGRVPRPHRPVHLAALRVAHGAHGDPGDDPRRGRSASGIYSVFGFEVTPATIVAFLTVLGYSLYDSIVVFDRIRDNERRIAGAGLSAGDLINVSTNQVLLRSINTTLASALPVASLLLVGAGLFGSVTLREFAIALLVGMLTGAYSSIFVAAPLLGWLKGRSAAFAGRRGSGHLVGEDLRAVVVAGPGGVRVAHRPPAPSGHAGEAGARRRDRRRRADRRLGATGAPAHPPTAPSEEEEALSNLGT